MKRLATVNRSFGISSVLLMLCLAGCEGPGSLSSVGDQGEEGTDTGEDEGDDEADDDQGSQDDGGFIPDVEPPDTQCDPFAQDCPDGEKCVPYASDGGNWNANKCVPVVGDGQPGDTCTWDGVIAATDSCGVDSHCWDVMDIDGQLQGICTAFCGGSADDPICGAETSCLIANEGSITLCVTTCDPLLQECAEGLGCFWANNDFQCIFTAGDQAPSQPCGFINDCVPSAVCLQAEAVPDCEGSACCASYCDLADPECAVEGTECVPFFEEGSAPPTYEDIGICILPG